MKFSPKIEAAEKRRQLERYNPPISPLSAAARIVSGIFNLFSHRDNPDIRLAATTAAQKRRIKVDREKVTREIRREARFHESFERRRD